MSFKLGAGSWKPGAFTGHWSPVTGHAINEHARRIVVQLKRYPLIERKIMPGWISVFRVVPWMDLIAAAPAIARGARKLWTGVRTQPEAETPQGMGERVERLESEVAELKKGLAASSELIKALAEQNERLVEAVGVLRARQRLLIGGCVVLLVLATAVAVQLWAA